ncbi:MAG: PBSX family phage terminase large subunit, partial [Phenylobacterium sp.]|nr:PBSX family phage terminase large subunit [Phenylobacterium sp.]
VNWLRERGYDKALCVLPHDGAQGDKVFAVSYESALREAGFSVEVVPNQGRGAASARIEAARRLFPAIWFHAGNCAGGLDALGHYHEKRDEARGIGLGPEHDWSSHGADAFGLMAVAYEAPVERRKPRTVAHAGGWMS